MLTENLAKTAKQRFVFELENNIPEEGNFEKIICSEILPNGYYAEFSLSSMNPDKGVVVSVTAKKEGRIHTVYLFRGPAKKAECWLLETDEKEFSEKAEKAVFECESFYYP